MMPAGDVTSGAVSGPNPGTATTEPPAPPAAAAGPTKFLVRFALRGELRFLSHLDLMRLFERAARRAGLPLRFSEGYNTRPQLSLPTPHSVGIGGEDEPLLIELHEPADPAELVRRLAAGLPAGAVPTGVVEILTPAQRVRPDGAEYLCLLPPGVEVSSRSVEELRDRLAAGGLLPAKRGGAGDGEPARTTEVGRFVKDIRWEGGAPADGDVGTPTGSGDGSAGLRVRALRIRVALTDGGSAKPGDVLAALGLPPDEVLRTECIRTKVDVRLVSAGPAWTPKKVRPPVDPDTVAEGGAGEGGGEGEGGEGEGAVDDAGAGDAAAGDGPAAPSGKPSVADC